MSGAQGLLARPVNAVRRSVWTTGSSESPSGIGGGPFGLPTDAALSVRSTVGLLAVMALLPVVSNRPPAIHFRKTSSSLSGSFGLFGGMVGSSAWVMAFQSLLLSGLPARTTGPEPPPFNAPL